MVVRVIRAVVPLGEPGGFSIGHLTEGTRSRGFDLLLLAYNCANLQTLVLWTEEYFVLVEAKECLSSILSGCK